MPSVARILIASRRGAGNAEAFREFELVHARIRLKLAESTSSRMRSATSSWR